MRKGLHILFIANIRQRVVGTYTSDRAVDVQLVRWGRCPDPDVPMAPRTGAWTRSSAANMARPKPIFMQRRCRSGKIYVINSEDMIGAALNTRSS